MPVEVARQFRAVDWGVAFDATARQLRVPAHDQRTSLTPYAVSATAQSLFQLLNEHRFALRTNPVVVEQQHVVGGKRTTTLHTAFLRDLAGDGWCTGPSRWRAPGPQATVRPPSFDAGVPDQGCIRYRASANQLLQLRIGNRSHGFAVLFVVPFHGTTVGVLPAETSRNLS